MNGWLDWGNDCDTLRTEPPGTQCGFSILTGEKVSWAHMRALFPFDTEIGQFVLPSDAYSIFGGHDFGEAVHGYYLFDSATETLLARLEVATP